MVVEEISELDLSLLRIVKLEKAGQELHFSKLPEASRRHMILWS